MNKTEFLELLKQLVSDAIVQDITMNSDGDDIYHARYIDVDRFIAAIDAELCMLVKL